MGKRTVLSQNQVQKSKTIEFTWQGLLGSVNEIPEGYKTAMEIGKETGVTAVTVTRKMKELINNGTVSYLKRGNKTFYKINR